MVGELYGEVSAVTTEGSFVGAWAISDDAADVPVRWCSGHGCGVCTKPE